jgi:hypothetical protein
MKEQQKIVYTLNVGGAIIQPCGSVAHHTSIHKHTFCLMPAQTPTHKARNFYSTIYGSTTTKPVLMTS